MRGALVKLLRATHLIEFADGLAALRAVQNCARANEDYRAAHPRRLFPNPALVYEVSAHAHLQSYDQSGQDHAHKIASFLKAAELGETPAILDWGCGPGRVLAHLPAALNKPGARFHGCDPNARAIAFARGAFPIVTFTQIGAEPPTPYPDHHFDAVYGVSILTHLSLPRAKAWLAELARLLQDGGVAILTSHGSEAAIRLSPERRMRFEAGDYVELAGAEIGSRTYVSYFNETAGRRLFAPYFADVTCHTPSPDSPIGHDIWVLRAPRRPSA